MFREGPIPAAVHGLIEYAAGVLCIIAPFLLGFDSGAATAVSIVVGVAVIAFAASTDMPTGIVSQLSRTLHSALDFGLAALLIASPFLFGFSEETAPTVFFIVLGLAHLLITIGTRFRPPKQKSGRDAA